MTKQLPTIRLSLDRPMHLSIKQDNGERSEITVREFPKAAMTSAIALDLMAPSAQGVFRLEIGVGIKSGWATYYSFKVNPSEKWSDDVLIFFSEGLPFVQKGEKYCSLTKRREVIESSNRENQNPNDSI